MNFELHPRLAQDCIVIGDLPLCRVLLMNDANYPWLILVPRINNLTEIHQLSREDQYRLMDESSLVASTMAEGFSARKMNVASLGNVVNQLHIHHVVRYEEDAAWPRPIWGAVSPQPYSAEHLQKMRDKLSTLFGSQVVYA